MNNRRHFLKLSGCASLGLAGGSALSACAAESVAGTPRVQRFNMSGFVAPKIDKVHVGIIGLGQRGPHTMIHAITGTKGLAQEYPLPPRISKDLTGWLPQEEYDAVVKEYTPPLVTRSKEMTEKWRGHGGGDILESWRLIDCLRNGFPLDMDVYDAAAWSSIVPLSEQSVLSRSNSVDIPDFTMGSWQTNKPNMDIMLTHCGDTKVLD